MIDTNAKLHYCRTVKSLIGDIKLVEAGNRSYDVLGTLSVNCEVANKQMERMQVELAELTARAKRCLRK
jgi:hypothetical protein